MNVLNIFTVNDRRQEADVPVPVAVPLSLDEGDGRLDHHPVRLFTVPQVGLADAVKGVPLRDVLLGHLCI